MTPHEEMRLALETFKARLKLFWAVPAEMIVEDAIRVIDAQLKVLDDTPGSTSKGPAPLRSIRSDQ